MKEGRARLRGKEAREAMVVSRRTGLIGHAPNPNLPYMNDPAYPESRSGSR